MVQLELLHPMQIFLAASNLRSINKYYLHIYHYGADMSAMKVVCISYLCERWSNPYSLRKSTVDQLSPVCCGAATDSNEAFELFRR